MKPSVESDLKAENERLRRERDALARSFVAFRSALLEGTLDILTDRDYEEWQGKIARLLEGSVLTFEKAKSVLSEKSWP